MNFNIRWWSGRWQKPTVLRTAGRGASIGAGCTTCSGAYHAGAVRCSHSQNCVPCESTSRSYGKTAVYGRAYMAAVPRGLFSGTVGTTLCVGRRTCSTGPAPQGAGLLCCPQKPAGGKCWRNGEELMKQPTPWWMWLLPLKELDRAGYEKYLTSLQQRGRKSKSAGRHGR